MPALAPPINSAHDTPSGYECSFSISGGPGAYVAVCTVIHPVAGIPEAVVTHHLDSPSIDVALAQLQSYCDSQNNSLFGASQ